VILRGIAESKSDRASAWVHPVLFFDKATHVLHFFAFWQPFIRTIEKKTLNAFRLKIVIA
jgi:hypothetical protein